jgi:predicted TIM-barrel fold metal-dependent hydrolase
VQRTIDGRTAWYLDDERWASVGGNTIQVGHEKVRGLDAVQPFDKIDPSAWAVKERLELLDEVGIFAQILYPNGIGFSSNHVFAIEDEVQRTTILQTYNDFLVEVQDESNGRLFPQALLPIWDVDLTVSEMTRLIDKGIRGFTLSDRPELLGFPELPEPHWDPMWSLFNESGAVANFHIGSGRRRDETEARKVEYQSRRGGSPAVTPSPASIPAVANQAWSSFNAQRLMAVRGAQGYISNVRIMVNLCLSDLFDRYPKLKVVSAESGIGWVPFMLEALEYQFDQMVTLPAERNFAQRRPAEYFRDHLYVMFWFEQSGPAKMLEDVGINNVLIETDIPHPTCLYPNPMEHFSRVLAGVGPDAVKRVLQDNAAELYKIPIPTTPPK